MTSKDLARGTIYLTLQQLISYATAFVFYFGIARIISQEEVGLWSILMASTATFTTLTLLGLQTAAQKYIAEHLAKGRREAAASAFRVTLELTAGLTLPVLALALALLPSLSQLMLGESRYAAPLALVLAASALLNFNSLLSAEMLGLGMYLQLAIQSIAFAIIARGLGLAFAYSGQGLLGLALGWLIGGASCLILSIRLTWRKLPKPTHPQGKLYREILAYSYPLWLLAIIALAQGWGDLAILYAVTGESASTGAYYLASAGATLLAIFWVAMSTAIFPAMSAGEARIGRDALRPIFRTASRLLDISILPLGAGLAAVSRTAIFIAYGPAYATSITPFAILTATAILPAYLAINTSALQAIAETKALAKAGAISALVDIALVSILARFFSADGAALARVAMYVTAFLLTRRALAIKARIDIDRGHIVKASAMAVAIALPLASIDFALTEVWQIHGLLRIAVEGAAFLPAYLLALRYLRLVEMNDLELLRKALPHWLSGPIDTLKRMIVM